MITIDQLKAIMPSAGMRASIYLKPLNDAMDACEISLNVKRVICFLAEVGHESGDLLYSSEIWGPAQVPVQAGYKARMGNNKPEAIAISQANGEADPGKYFRGYGPIQVTGFDNQCQVADHFGVSHGQMVPWLKSPEGGCKASAFFWQSHGLNEIADTDNWDNVADEFDAMSDIINRGQRTPRLGDSNGWLDRLAHYDRAKRVLMFSDVNGGVLT